MKTIQASRCGSRAHPLTRSGIPGQVIGVTSRGIFLKIGEAGVVFLSSEPHQNPLSVNLEPFPAELRQLNFNDPVFLREGSLVFPKLNLEILIPLNVVSELPKKPRISASKSQRLRIMIGICGSLHENLEPDHLAYILPEFLRGESPQSDARNPLGIFSNINAAFAQKNLDALLPLLAGFIGAGRGLTPAGDDLLTGFLLTINRWNPYRWPKSLIRLLNENIIALARQKTTTLSAAILASAAGGDADERLITALDSIFTSTPPPDQAAGLLLSYGSSSGSDAYCGMALAIK